MPLGPVLVLRTAASASARDEMGVRGGSEDACEETEALEGGRAWPCTRAGVEGALGGGEEYACVGPGVGTGEEGAWAKGLFELRAMPRHVSASCIGLRGKV